MIYDDAQAKITTTINEHNDQLKNMVNLTVNNLVDNVIVPFVMRETKDLIRPTTIATLTTSLLNMANNHLEYDGVTDMLFERLKKHCEQNEKIPLKVECHNQMWVIFAKTTA